MMGLPTETLEDLDGIAKIARGVVDVWRKTSNNRARGVRVSASVACFVPKPGTPFQWEPMDTVEQLREKQEHLKGIMRIKNVDFSWHDPVTSHLEAVFARGDRRLCAVIYDAWRRGCRFDGWDDQLRMDLWHEAFAACGVDMAYYANRARSFDEALPWEHIYNGVTREHLMMENLRAHSGLASEDCRAGCAGCGALELWREVFAMSELRLVFEKRGNARYISHLDLMQVFRRAFARANVPVGFSQGFHPHPAINILLPLPTGFESQCELLDFTLDAPRLPDNFLYLINRALPAGICVTSVGESRTPAKFIRYAAYEIYTELAVPPEAMTELFARDELVVTKRTKRGESETDILPLLRGFHAEARDGGAGIRVTVAAGE